MHVVDCMDVYFQLAYNELFWKTMCWCRLFIKLYQTSLGLNWCLQLIFCQKELLLFSKEKEFIPFPLRRVFDNLSWNSKILSVSAWLWRYFIPCYKLLLRVDDISCHSVNSSRNQISTNYLPTHLSQWIHWAKRRHKCYIFILPVYTIFFLKSMTIKISTGMLLKYVAKLILEN